MNNYNLLINDKELNDLIDSINEINKDNLFNCHGRYHTHFVINTIEKLLSSLNFDEYIIELGKIAGLLHDISTINGKKGHAYRSSKMCIYFLDKTKLSQESKDIIVHAIKDHSNGNEIDSPVGAALVLADKIDICKNRVLELGKEDRWHNNLLNIEKTILIVEKRKIIINYIVNDKFSSQILLEKWKKGITLPIKASRYFGCKCIFQLNGNIIDLT